MLSYEKRQDLARKFVSDANIEETERPDVPVYVVKDIGEVIAAYAAELENVRDEDGGDLYDNMCSEDIQLAINTHFEGDDVGEFLDRNGIEWK